MYSQESKPDPIDQKSKPERIEFFFSNPVKSSEMKIEKSVDEKLERIKSIQFSFYKAPVELKENYRFDLIQSVNSNVKFRGFYNGSINIQFSPAMYIKPYEFLSIYANHQKNLFIPITDIRDNALSLAIETTGMALIENAVKFFAPANNVVRGLTEFTLKNCISFLMYSIFNSPSNNNSRVTKYDFYYLSAGITF